MYRFIAQPAWSLTPSPDDDDPSGFVPLEVAAPAPAVLERALSRVEYRTLGLLVRLEQIAGASPNVFAKPPNDLPALLRTADQLLTIARQEAGERATFWRCECGSRYAVPVSLMRPVSIRCERCGRTLDLDPGAGSTQLEDPATAALNDYRRTVSTFFKEAMARGWPVLVAKA